jgi:hypothetical protein
MKEKNNYASSAKQKFNTFKKIVVILLSTFKSEFTILHHFQNE